MANTNEELAGQLEAASAAVNTLARELDVTNADHVALWLEGNTIPDEPMSQCISWLACRIVEAHERAIAALRAPQPQPASAEVAGLVEPWADHHGDLPDYDHPLRCVFESGIEYAVRLLAKTLDVEDYPVCDGTEEFDGDLGGTLLNIVLEAMPKDEDGDPIYPSELRERLTQPPAATIEQSSMVQPDQQADAVEAVARALWDAQCDHWGKYKVALPDLTEWDDLSQSKQRELCREAQAALAAHEPTVLRRIAEAVESERKAWSKMLPIRVEDGPDYATVYFGDGSTHSTQAMTMNPQDWIDLSSILARGGQS